MGAFLLQNRTLPWSPTSRVVYSWPLDKPESFCLAPDDAFTDTAHRVIVAGTNRCALHCMAEYPCVRAERTPPECPHERLDPQADPAHPHCVICGAVGADVSARYLRTTERARALVPDAQTYSEVTVGDA
jgi:hypothetical protein